MKRYTLLRHLGEPALKALKFKTGVSNYLGRHGLENLTAGELRELAKRVEDDAPRHREIANSCEADAKKLRTLADDMDSPTGTLL
jgi:hypothetical protein